MKVKLLTRQPRGIDLYQFLGRGILDTPALAEDLRPAGAVMAVLKMRGFAQLTDRAIDRYGTGVWSGGGGIFFEIGKRNDRVLLVMSRIDASVGGICARQAE